MAFTDADMEYWKQQLLYADRAWYEAGLVDGPGVNGTRHLDVVPIHRYIDDYRGEQSKPFAHGVENEEQFIGNLSFALTNTMHSLISGSDPEVFVRPKGETLGDGDAWRRGRLNQVLIQSQAREARYKREMDRMLQCAYTAPFGLVRHGYTPSIDEYIDDDGNVFERFKNQKPDYPWIRFYRPWDVRIDPSVGNFDPDAEVRWVAFRDVYYERDLKRLAKGSPDVHFPRDLQPTFTPEPYRQKEQAPRETDAPELAEMYEVWTIYDASERKWFAISPGSSKPIRTPNDWPLEWGQLPYSILTFNEQLDTPFGIPFPKVYAHEQQLYNKVWTIISTIVSRVRRLVFVNGDALSDDQKRNLFDMASLAEFIECSGSPSDVIREVALGVIDPQLIGLLYQLRESIREVIGVSNFDRGQRVNVETAAEAQQIGAGASVQRGRSQGKFEEVWTEVFRVSHRALMQVQDPRKFVIPVIGQENASWLTNEEASRGFAQVGIADLAGEFDYGVKIDSTLQRDTASEYAKSASLYQLAGGPKATMIQQQKALQDLANLVGVDGWVTPPEQVAAQAKAQDQSPGANPVADNTGGTVERIASALGRGG